MVSEKSFILLVVSSTTPFFTVLAIIFCQDCSWPALKPGDNFINKQADGELKFIDNSRKQAEGELKFIDNSHKQAEGELKFIDNSSLVSISDYNFSVNDNSFILEIIQIDKLIRVTALVITFIAILRQKKEERMVGSTKRLLFTSCYV